MNKPPIVRTRAFSMLKHHALVRARLGGGHFLLGALSYQRNQGKSIRQAVAVLARDLRRQLRDEETR